MLYILMKTISYSRGRNRKNLFSSDSTLLTDLHHHKPFLGKTLKIPFLFLFLLSGCSDHDSVPYDYSGKDATDEVKASDDCTDIDLLVFNDDELMHLDSYVRTEGFRSNSLDIRSQNGDKIVFACINSQWERYDWADISSFPSLSGIYADLRKEKRGNPLMRGIMHIEAGSPAGVSVSPIASEVCLRSIRCDFSGKSYEGETITDVLIYLTNVNVRCSLTEYEDIIPTHIINHGGLNESETDEFYDPGMILQSTDDISYRLSVPDIRLLCYPNNSKAEGPGTPYTRLVVEGSIRGTRYWWPIVINRSKGQEGIGCNCRYIYDLTITGKGSDSPDKDIDMENISINMEVKPWEEKEEYQILF